jgi:probable F420-dependent oxidoreductase
LLPAYPGQNDDVDLTGTGIWSTELRRHGDDAEEADAAAELDELGYSILWLPGGEAASAFNALTRVLRATTRAGAASGILSIWEHDPETVAAERVQLDDAYEGRFLLGLGVSHAPLVDREEPGRYRRPLTAMRDYLESLDVAAPPVPQRDRVLAALGPKMLELARDRAGGAHPYLVTVEHTRRAREILGGAPLLAPEQGVVLETDADRARSIARGRLEMYMSLPNYTNNLRRLGFGDEDFQGGGSDRLVDALVAWGDEQAIRDRIDAHREAGADHVCIQVLTDGREALPRAEWRALADALVPGR